MSQTISEFASANAGVDGPRFIMVMGKTAPEHVAPNPGVVPEDGIARILTAGGGKLRINAAAPLRTYEYVLHLPRVLLLAEWPGEAEVMRFIDSPAMAELKAAAERAECGVGLFPPASDWDASLTGAWTEPVGPSAPCDSPICHVTSYDVTRDSSIPTAKSGWNDLNAFRRWGGVPMTNRAPQKILAGDWPEGRSVLSTRWPCREAFEVWYLSDHYQHDIKPNRLASGRYTLAHYPAAS